MGAKIEIGDIVQLKSGGPEMTVENLLEGDRVYCKWFIDDGKEQSNSFQKGSLKKINIS